MWKKQPFRFPGKRNHPALKVITYIAIIAIFLSQTTQETYAILFSISNPQSDGEKVTFDVSLSGLSCPNTKCYLQAAFTKPGNNHYFGFTQNHNSDWYKYNGTPDTSYIQSTFFSFEPVNGSWSGQLTIKVNVEDPDYNGPGSYDIKAWRYTGNSTSYAGSSDNAISADLTSQAPTPAPTPTSTPTPTPAPSPTSTTATNSTPSPSPKVTPKPTITAARSSSPSASPQVLGDQNQSFIASDAGLLDAGSPASTTFQNAPSKKVAGILIVSGVGLILFALGFHLWYRKINKGKIHETKDPFEL
jgi:hypothetical protein